MAVKVGVEIRSRGVEIFAVVEQSSADITGSYVGARIRIVGNEKFGVVA